MAEPDQFDVTEEWCEMQADFEMLAHEVVAECEALRRGVAVSYRAGHDPVRELKLRLPSIEQIRLTRPSVKRSQSDRSADAT